MIDPGSKDDQLALGERQLSAVLTHFAQTMVTDFSIEAILDQLVERIVEILPVSGAGVTLIESGSDPRYVAASNASALQFEKLQSELGEGPCMLAFRSGRTVEVPDLRVDELFPAFSGRAMNAGMAAVFTFPLHHGVRRFGALDLYRDVPGPLSPESIATAKTLADVVASYLLNAQAREDLQEFSARSQQAALHDALTGLPNRLLLIERLDHAFQRSRRSRRASAVYFIDLDRFKAVNDTHGHAVGDELLIAVARRLTGQVRPSDTLARLSGDEYVVLCEDLESTEQAARIGERITDALRRPFHVAGMDVLMSASIGIAYSTGAEKSSEQLLHDADMAMYQAKNLGGSRLQLFDPRQQYAVERQAALEADLHHAVAHGELHLQYQPIATTDAGRICGLEALLRWDHPTRGPVPPGTVIPLAEKSQLIGDIGKWVLSQAWSDRARWHEELGIGLTMAVNVSPQQLMSPGFTATVEAALAAADTDPALLTLEITENVFLQDRERAALVLQDLKSLGLLIALDDFGTGYSSLQYLQQFPIDIIKIDKVFVSDLGRPTSSAIVAAVVNLAHTLGMSVTAEGIETAEQYRQVAELGCDRCQGYYFARPMPAAAVDAILTGGGRRGNVLLPLPGPGGEALMPELPLPDADGDALPRDARPAT